MPEVTETRRIAFDILAAVGQGELADRAVARLAAGLDSRDHGWLQELVYGTLRARGRLDFILANFVRKGLQSLDAPVLDILRLGAYQLLEMGSVPAYAAVSQSVDLARYAGVPKATGLVNGVLQSLRRRPDSVRYPDFDEDPAQYLTSVGSHPEWLVKRWLDRWEPADVRRLVEANNRLPALYLRPIGIGVDEGIRKLAEAGMEAEAGPSFTASIALPPQTDPRRALAAIPSIVQDPAASAVVDYASFPTAGTIVDLSAAPGGKTVAIGAQAEFVVGSDLSIGRMSRIRSNVQRNGLQNRIRLVVSDGRQPPFREVDGVLVDAPCTGTGTLRRHPDGRWRLQHSDISSLATLQAEILAGAATMVRPGGLLVYATCSLEAEENEDQIAKFLAEHADFQLDPPAEINDDLQSDGKLMILPHVHGVDGSFAARLRRKA